MSDKYQRCWENNGSTFLLEPESVKMDISTWEERSPGKGVPVSTGVAEFLVQLAKAITILSNHFIKKAVTMMMAGNPGHVNTVASKQPYLGTNQSWEKQLLKMYPRKPQETRCPESWDSLLSLNKRRWPLLRLHSIGNNAKDALGMVTHFFPSSVCPLRLSQPSGQ